MMSCIWLAPPRFTEKDLKKEYESLTEEERNAVRMDLHGERQPRIVETPEMVERALEELDNYIEQLPEKEAFEIAQISCPDYVNSHEFRLMFLRADLFDAKLAAKRLIKYWDEKVEVFGRDRAFHRLTLGDFDDEDQVALRNGGLKLLPEQDSEGRSLLFSYRANWDRRTTHRKSMIRVFWYMIHAALESEVVQKEGMLGLYANGIPDYCPSAHDLKQNRCITRQTMHAIPIRFAAMHHIAPDQNQILKIVIENTMWVLQKSARIRFKQHKDLESIEAYGIAAEICPQEIGGSLEFDYEHWLEDRLDAGR